MSRALILVALLLLAGCAGRCENERSMACMSAVQIERELAK